MQPIAPATSHIPGDATPSRTAWPRSLGLIAGSGKLPLICARTLHQAGTTRVVAVGHRGETDPELARWVEQLEWVHLGQVKRLLRFLERQQVEGVVLAGGIHKPNIWKIRFDTLALKMLARLRHLHDDHLLRAVAAELEERGYTVYGVTDLVPELLTPAGILTRTYPTLEQWQDIRFGWQAAKELGRLDIGQGVVVRQRVVVAVEALEGTDAMIARAGQLIRNNGVMVKVAKPQQDRRLDLPAIGPVTMENLHRAGIGVLALEAGGSMILDAETTLALADKHGLVVAGCTADDPNMHQGYEQDERES